MTVAFVDNRSSETGNSSYDEENASNTRQPQQPQQPSPAGALKRNTPGRIMPATPMLSPEVPPNAGVPENGDVSAVVVKAKKAAQSLWVLIHAQNCRIGTDRCPHKGCVEAKRVLLHLKTCPAGNNGCSCPSNYNGCHQSRKLLAHYQKCRELRAKQAGMGRRTKSQHVCLVCSLVARHARNVLEGSSRKSNAKKQVIASFTLAEPVPEVSDRRLSTVAMPPPPPRQPGSTPIQRIRSPMHMYSESSSEDGMPCESPPSRNQLMLFSEVAAAAAPPSHPPCNSAALGKSLDSSKSPFLTLAASALQNLKRASPTEEEEELPEVVPTTSPRRSRAGSYDERALVPLQNQRHEQHEDVVRQRARSASLGMLASACLTRNGNATCDTILEEESMQESMREEEAFSMDEDTL
jgi:hypothetical protein